LRIAYSNEVDGATIFSSSENANYPDTNLAVTNTAKTYRSTGVADEYVRLDAGTGQTITASGTAIANHNLTSAVSVIIRAASSAAALASAPTTSVAVVYNEAIMMVYFTENTERFWQLDIEDPTNGDSYLEVGRWFLGSYLQVDPSSYVEFDLNLRRSDRVAFSITNQAYSDKGIEFWDITYDFPPSQTATAKSNIETFFTIVGKFKPFFFTNFDSTYTVIEPIYCILVDDIIFKNHGGNRFSYSLHLREVN
jgi:hypothetical protein